MDAAQPQNPNGTMAPEMIRTDELLTTACFRGELERVREMLDHGAATSARCERLTTALHWAASMGHLDVCELLVERGGDVNARSVTGESPLHIAAREGNLASAEFLLGAGANPRLCSSTGRTALELALEFADDEVELIHLLRSAQAQHDARALRAKSEADAPARRKVQIVWESDLQAQSNGQPPSSGDGAASGTVDSACGSDEPLDLSDGATNSAALSTTASSVNDAMEDVTGAVTGSSATTALPSSDADALAARLAKWGIEPSPAPSAGEDSSDAAPSVPLSNEESHTRGSEAIQADALFDLATKLFTWDSESKEALKGSGLPG